MLPGNGRPRNGARHRGRRESVSWSPHVRGLPQPVSSGAGLLLIPAGGLIVFIRFGTWSPFPRTSALEELEETAAMVA